jgi:AcrR family transcriptional regulator
MARPRVPLISRRKALEAALDIIDNEGLKALSIRRLGEVMNVNGASLYHHFKDKDDILVGVAQLALADVTAPRSSSDNWRVWLPLNASRTRQALIAHPELIPLMLRRIPLGIGNQEVEASVARLLAEGVEMSVIAPLMESFELLAISSALQTVGGVGGGGHEGADDADDSLYLQAQKERGLTNDELFEVVCAAVIASVESAVHLKEARASIGAAAAKPTRPAAAKTAAVKTAGAPGKPAAAKTKTNGTTRKSAAAARGAGATRKPAAKAATAALEPATAAEPATTAVTAAPRRARRTTTSRPARAD